MPESAAEVHARVAAAAGEDGRLPTPAVVGWESFPWEVVDGALVPKVLRAPGDEAPRAGEVDAEQCPTCRRDPARDVWENERWIVTRLPEPTGLPVVLFLQTKEHLDFTDLGDEMAAEYGRLTIWLTRIMSHLPEIGRVHVNRWGDGSAHFHVWFMARTRGLTGVRGSFAAEWDDILPPTPEDVWKQDLATIATKLANHDGRALV